MNLEALERIRENMDAGFDELHGHLDSVGAQALAEEDLSELARLFELLTRIKTTFDVSRKGMNKARDAVSSHFSMQLMQQGEAPYQHELGSFSPSARAFADIVDAKAFYEWLKLAGVEDPLKAVCEYATTKKPLQELVEKHFESGEAQPAGLRVFAKSRVRFRPKRKGPKEKEQPNSGKEQEGQEGFEF